MACRFFAAGIHGGGNEVLDDFHSFVELRVQHFKQLGIVGEERPVEIGRVEDEDIPARFEFDRAFEISFVDPGRFCFALELHPFRIHRMPRTTATEFNV